MKRKTAEQLASSLTGTLASTLAAAFGSPNARRVIEEVATEFLVRQFLPLPEPTAEKMEEIRETAKRSERLLGTDFMRIAKKLPKSQGGRRKALTPEQVGRAWHDMAFLLYDGVEKSDALKRIAARYKISKWTMSRYWQEYQRVRKSKETKPSMSNRVKGDPTVRR